MNKLDRRIDFFKFTMVLIVVMFIFSSMVLILGVLLGDKPTESIQDICRSCNNIYGSNNDYNADLILKLDTIQKNCGTIHITKKLNDDNYYIFKISKKDGWSKPEYILLEDCLKNDN